jgi:hypothetical protein
MVDRVAKFVLTKSKSGESFEEISRKTNLSVPQVKEKLAQVTRIGVEDLDLIFHMKRSKTLEEISEQLDLDIEVLSQFLPDTSPSQEEAHETRTQFTTATNVTEARLDKTRQFSQMTQEQQFIYSYEAGTSRLWRTNLATGEASVHEVRSFEFKAGSCWSELPWCLLVTGGDPPTNEVVRIDTRTYEVSREARMKMPRVAHCAVYCAGYLYVFGGHSGSNCLSDCERFAESRWEAVSPLPKAGCYMSGVAVKDQVFVMGGSDDSGTLDCFQRLSLRTLTWDLLELNFPLQQSIVCVLATSKVYFIVKKTLYSFQPETRDIEDTGHSVPRIKSWFGPSYYRGGVLYCSSYQGKAKTLEIGD